MGTPLYSRFRLLILVLLVAGAMDVKAQDIHFSQFGNSPLNLSPALTGVFYGDARLNFNYRSQWNNVPVDYQTFSAAYDMKFWDKCKCNSPFSGALLFNYDVDGDSKMSLTQIGLAASYTQQLAEQHFITAGFMLGGMQRAFEEDALRWDVQFDGKLPDFGIPSGENFSDMSRFMFDISAGANWHIQIQDKKGEDEGETCATCEDFGSVPAVRPRFSLNLGAALFHVNKPNTSFFDDAEVKLRSRASIYAIGALKVAPVADIVFKSAAQFQGVYRETLVGLGARFYVKPDPNDLLAFQLGGNLRFGDAFFPQVEIFVKNWQFGFTYDINFSDFDIATLSNGGPEFSVRYIINKVKTKPKGICPIYI